MISTKSLPFWESKTLEEFTTDEWEALCDRCGLCCLNRLQDDEDDEAPVLLTRVACRCYDLQSLQCGDYSNRMSKVEGCVSLTPEKARTFEWLPETCAYRRLHFGLPLPSWHPLITQNSDSVKPYGIFALDPVLEDDTLDLEDFIVEM